MTIPAQPSPAADLAAYRRLIARLPVTLRPELNARLAQWPTLFPFEQDQFAAFLRGIQSTPSSQLDALTRPLWDLETRMGVARWDFSQSESTVENASLLARSPYYPEWRQQVDRFFQAMEHNAQPSTASQPGPAQSRLVLLLLPEHLPVDPAELDQRWRSTGRAFRIDGDPQSLRRLALQGQPGTPSLASVLHPAEDTSQLWLIDAEDALARDAAPALAASASSLSFTGLAAFRRQFLAGINTIPRNISATDQVIAQLRRQDWSPWYPAALAGQPRLQQFVLNLWLSGNGALIFPNAFVEWTASEALRRARPRMLVARFGMQTRPKPFTSIAIFEDQQKISALPSVDDPESSALDAVMLSHYIWLAALRYPQGDNTFCLCVAEHARTAWLVAPPNRWPAWAPGQSIAPQQLYQWLAAQLAS